MDSQKIVVHNPFDNSLIDELTLHSARQAEEAIQTAHQYYLNRDDWLKKHHIIALLEQFILLIEKNKEALILTAVKEGGKPLIDSRVELDRAITGVITAIETIPHITGSEVPMGLSAGSDDRMAYTFREPRGVVLAISAFNHPLNLIIHQVIPAIATGCPVIVKPALKTPLSCQKLVNLLHEAGVPKEMCQMILCDNATTEKVVTDPRISFLSFIGSGKVGWYLRSRIAPGAMCTLEHGGVAPIILEEDANLNDVLPLIVKGGFYHAGQVCVSTQRVFVHHRIIKQVSKRLTELTSQLVTGNPLDDKTDVGPLITKDELKRIELWVNQAVENGARLLCGGKILHETCYAPTLLLDPPQDVNVSKYELFGPVVCLYTYKERLDAIKLANSLPFVFQAAVMTQNINIALDTVKRLNGTTVMVNDHTAFRVDWMPFGGRRHSGLGMGGIPYSMHELAVEKMMVIRHKPAS